MFMCIAGDLIPYLFLNTSGKMLGISWAVHMHCIWGKTKHWHGIGKIEQVCEKRQDEWRMRVSPYFHFTRSSVEHNYGSLAPHSCVYHTCLCLTCAWCVHAKLCNFHSTSRTQKKIILMNAKYSEIAVANWLLMVHRRWFQMRNQEKKLKHGYITGSIDLYNFMSIFWQDVKLKDDER